MAIKLKNCPFCGGEAELQRVGNDYHKKQIAQVECQTFGCFAIQKVAIITGRATYKWAEEKVINLWNTRAPIGDKNGN